MAEFRKGGDTSPVRFRNKGVAGFTCTAYLLASAVNTALDIDSVNPTKVNVSVTLTRFGVSRKVVIGDLRVLHKTATFHTEGYNAVLTGTSGFVQEVLHTASVKAVIAVPFTIDLKGVYQLTGDDQVDIELNFDSATTFGAAIDQSNSGFFVDSIDSDAPESGTPYITIESITVGQNAISTNLPANCKTVYFVNNDKTTERNADTVLNSASVNYSTGKVKADFRQLAHLRKAYSVTSINRAQTFQIASFGRYGVTGATLDLTLNSSNVTSSNNYIVYYHDYVDTRLLKNADYQASLSYRAAFDGIKVNA